MEALVSGSEDAERKQNLLEMDTGRTCQADSQTGYPRVFPPTFCRSEITRRKTALPTRSRDRAASRRRTPRNSTVSQWAQEQDAAAQFKWLRRRQRSDDVQQRVHGSADGNVGTSVSMDTTPAFPAESPASATDSKRTWCNTLKS